MKIRKRVFHKAKLISQTGDVSPVCADVVPRAINLKKASWTLRWEAVTCRACLRRRPKEEPTTTGEKA